MFTYKFTGDISPTEIIPPHTIHYNGIDYSDRIKELDIEQVPFDFHKLNIPNDLHIVHKIAILKYYLLSQGGVWCDMDILFVKPMEHIDIDTNIDFSISYYTKNNQGFYYTGFLFGAKNNKFYSDLCDIAKKHIDPTQYLSLDQILYKKIYPDPKSISEKYPDCSIYNLDENSVYKYAWGDLGTFYEKPVSHAEYQNILNTKGLIGFHWFGGVALTSTYMNNYDRPLRLSGFNGIINNLLDDAKLLDKNYIKPDYKTRKISIVMAYHNRKEQLLTTLKTIEQSKHPNFEVIIVDDASSPNQQLTDLSYPFVKLITIRDKNWVNPCIPFNMGFKQASGDIIIIQNPECCHVGDILCYIENNLSENDYFTFTCFSSQSHNMNAEIRNIILDNNTNPFWHNDKHQKLINLTKSVKHFDYKWYNHTWHNPSNLNFLSAIYKTQLDKIGGFDEIYKDGYCFDDNDLLTRIKYTLNLDIKIIPIIDLKCFTIPYRMNVYCIHQFHDSSYANFQSLYNKNKALFIQNHHKLVDQVLNKMANTNLCAGYNYVSSNNTLVTLTDDQIKIHNPANINVRFIINTPNSIISAANQGKSDIKTNLCDLTFIISFEANSTKDNTYLIIDSGKNKYTPLNLTTEFKKHEITTQLDPSRWNIFVNTHSITLKNLDIRLHK